MKNIAKAIILILSSVFFLNFAVGCDVFEYKNGEESTNTTAKVTTSPHATSDNEDYSIQPITQKSVLSKTSEKYEKGIKEIMFPYGYKCEFADYPMVTRWAEPIKIGLAGYYSYKDQDAVVKFIKELNNIEEVPEITFAMNNNDSNFAIVFGSRDYMRIGYSSANYYDNHFCIPVVNEKKYNITHATGYIINQSDRRKQNKYIARVILEGLGIGHHQSKTTILSSVFNQNSAISDFSELDKVAVRIVYSGRITVKMKEEKFSKNINSLLWKYYDFTTTTTSTTTRRTTVANTTSINDYISAYESQNVNQQ